MVGLAFGNSPAAMPAAGGKRALFGTNPIAAVFPRRDGAPLSIDLSLSEVARGKVMVAAKEGQADSARLGARRGRPADDRCEGRARRVDARDGRHERRDARARRRVAGDGADRRGDGVRSELLLRRRRQSAANRAGVPRHRSRRARRTRRLPRARRNADRRDARRRRRPPAGRAPRRARAAVERAGHRHSAGACRSATRACRALQSRLEREFARAAQRRPQLDQ